MAEMQGYPRGWKPPQAKPRNVKGTHTKKALPRKSYNLGTGKNFK